MGADPQCRFDSPEPLSALPPRKHIIARYMLAGGTDLDPSTRGGIRSVTVTRQKSPSNPVRVKHRRIKIVLIPFHGPCKVIPGKIWGQMRP